VKLYDKLKSINVVETQKEFSDLIWIREIWVNDHLIDDPNCEFKENDKIKVGIREIKD